MEKNLYLFSSFIIRYISYISFVQIKLIEAWITFF